MNEWRTRPLDAVYPVVFVDAIHVKIRDGQVANRPIYVAIAVTADGYREILGLWAGDGGEGAEFWQQVLTDLRNRGVKDVLMLVCDGLSALPDAVANVWPRTVVQRCVVHLIRQSLRYASRRDWPEVAADLKPVYTAVNEAQARERLDELDAKWGHKYGSIAGVWQRAWSEFVPFLAFPTRSVRLSTRPTASSPSTPATAGPPPPAGTSPTSRRRSRGSTWPPSLSTPPAADASAGTTSGRRR